MNVKKSMDKLKSMALSGSWNLFWLETVYDFPGFSDQQDEIKDMLVLAFNVLEGFQVLEEADIHDVSTLMLLS